jgi:hypothetical protein
MTISDFILQALVALAGGIGLVAFLLFYKTAKVPALAGLAIGLAAILVSGQSVLTTGVATFAGIAFVASQWISKWRQIIYQSFFAVFKIIWLGIGISAILNIGSVFWVWGEIAVGSAPWFFSEAVFAILVLTGVYIGKVIGPGISHVLKSGQAPSAGLIMKIAAAGGFSFVSWYTWLLTRQGFFEGWKTVDLFAMWIGAVLAVFSLTIISEALRKTINARRFFQS